MKKLLIAASLAACSITAQAADNALGVYTLTFRLGDSTYVDTLSITRKGNEGTYFGTMADGGPVMAEKQGNQLCASNLENYSIGEAFCFPLGKNKSPFAFYIASIITYDGTFLDKLGTLVKKASMTKSKLGTAMATTAIANDQTAPNDRQQRLEAVKSEMAVKH